MKDADQATDPLEDITLIPGTTEELLNERQYLNYRSEREQCLDWLLTFGIEPKTADGYAKTTVSNRAFRMDQFYRWVWDQEGGYTTNLTLDHADNYLRHLAGQQKSNAHKNSCRKALMMLYKWRHHQRGADKWEPEITFSRKNQSTTPRDYLTRKERTAIRDASLEYGSVPSRDSVHGDERDRWVAYLSQRFEKPKTEVTEADWERANKWKTPSLVAASLDGGLRPIEVDRALTSIPVDCSMSALICSLYSVGSASPLVYGGLQTIPSTSCWRSFGSRSRKSHVRGVFGWPPNVSAAAPMSRARGLRFRDSVMVCARVEIRVERILSRSENGGLGESS